MRQYAQIIIVLLAAFVGGLLLYTAPLRAADPTPIACPNGQTVFLEGQAPPGEAVLAYLRGRPVGGGLADASGHYRVPLRAQERPGSYLVEVRLRASRAVIATFTCFVDIPTGSEPSLTATVSGGAPVTGTTRATPATPTIAGTSLATPRPGVTGSPTATGTAATPTGTARTPTGSTTPTATLGTTTPTITTTATVTGGVVIRDIFLRDPVSPDDTDEFVEIENTGRTAVDISSWRLTNITRNGPTFIFPGYTLDPDMIIVVYTEVGDNDLESGEFFWDQSGDIWKVGEVAELRDRQNIPVATLAVPVQD